MLPSERDGSLRNANGTARIVRVGAAVTAGWLGLAMLAMSPALAERGKSPRPFPKYTVEVIYGVWCPVVQYEPISGLAVNSHGDVAGHLIACDQDHEAFIYPPGGGPLFVMPHAPTIHEVYGADLNDTGWLVGRIGQGGYKGFVYKPDGSLTLIPPPVPPGDWCEATGVNNAGVVIGWWANTVTGAARMAYRWENGIRTDLTEVPGPESEAYGISESGLITGWSGSSTVIDAHAFVWNDSKVTLLPPIPGGITSQGYSVNDRGDVCGRGRMFVEELGVYKSRAFAYIEGQMIAIPPLEGWTDHTRALGINSHGQVVGESGFGFLWQDNAVVALNELLVDPPPDIYISGARDIGNDGRIVAGCGFYTSGDALTCLLTPLPAADLSGDGIVNGFDLALLLGEWGCCPARCSADLNGDGCVNGFDLAMLLASWTS